MAHAYATMLTIPVPFSLQDFLIMFIHHLATVSLISFSYVNNMVRVGSLVMCVHDASDFLLEVSCIITLITPAFKLYAYFHTTECIKQSNTPHFSLFLAISEL